MPQDAVLPVSDPSPLSVLTEMVELRHTSPLVGMGGMSVLPRFLLVWVAWDRFLPVWAVWEDSGNRFAKTQNIPTSHAICIRIHASRDPNHKQNPIA